MAAPNEQQVRQAQIVMTQAIHELWRLEKENATLREFVGAFTAGELRDGEFGHCYICSARNFEAPHDADCPWVLARAYLG